MIKTLTQEESNKMTNQEYLNWLWFCLDETERELKVWKNKIKEFHKRIED